MNERFQCPCCGCLTLEERGSSEICDVCYWEDDGQDDHNADAVLGGPNGRLSLMRARANYRAFGACEESMLVNVRPPRKDELPDQQSAKPKATKPGRKAKANAATALPTVDELVTALDHKRQADIDAAERRLFKTHGREALIPGLVAAYSRIRHAAGRNSVLYELVPFARKRPEVVELAKAALDDPAYMPRMQACSLLAYSLRQDAIPHLKPLMKHRDKKTRDDAKAAIDAIKRQNHHYWLDRTHSGSFLWTVNPEDRRCAEPNAASETDRPDTIVVTPHPSPSTHLSGPGAPLQSHGNPAS
jgi:hypothetical protein